MIRRVKIAALLFALAFALPAAAAPPAPARPDPAHADAAIRAFVEHHRIPAAHVTIVRGEDVLLQRGYGNAPTPDARSLFPLGSISKQFTAATVLALADACKVRLDASVAEYLPEWFAGERGLRVAHLLAQTSGVADFLWLAGYRPLADAAATPIDAFVTLGAAAPRKFPPGTRWAYSNTNYKALASIAERVSGRPFDEVLTERVLRPLGIAGIAACHSLPPGAFVPGVAPDGTATPLDASAAAYVGDGGLCGNAAALTAWLRRAFATPGSPYARLARPTRLADGTPVPYGFGVSLREFMGQPMVWHGGSLDSHSALIAYLPAADLAIVILTSKGAVWLTELLPDLLGIAPPGRGAASVAPPAGAFDDGLFRYVLTPEGTSLRVKIDLIDTFEFVPAGGREYVAARFPATFRLRLPADGARDRFELDWGEFRSYARRVGN